TFPNLGVEEIFENGSRWEEAAEHHHPRLWVHVHVHCFSDMWKHRANCYQELQQHRVSWERLHQ
ncbi:hypothetical protein ILYODFUR_034333, partial [Ilyodon furcidens]